MLGQERQAERKYVKMNIDWYNTRIETLNLFPGVLHFGIYILVYILLYFTLILWYNIHTNSTKRDKCDSSQYL